MTEDVPSDLLGLANAQANASLAAVDLVTIFAHLSTSVVEAVDLVMIFSHLSTFVDWVMAVVEFDFHCL